MTMIMEERADDLEKLVTDAEANGLLLDAMRLHERLLLALQRYHPDPSAIVDEQKVRLCEAILKVEAKELDFQVARVGTIAVVAEEGGSAGGSAMSTPTSIGMSNLVSNAISRALDISVGSACSGAFSPTPSRAFSPDVSAEGARRQGASPDRSVTTTGTTKKQGHPGKARPLPSADVAAAMRSEAAAAARIVKQRQELARHAPLLTEALSLQGLLAFGDRLLSDGNVLPESRALPRLIRARAQILQSLASTYYKQGRPRAGVPFAQAALARFKQLLLPPLYVSVEVVKSFLALCTVLSASAKHREALQCIVQALEMTELLEQEYTGNQPAPRGGAHGEDVKTVDDDGHAPARATSASPAAVAAAAAAAGQHYPNLIIKSPPPLRVYVGSLEAACYHNAAVELEHLGLQELALVSYRSGYDAARHALGASHPLTANLLGTHTELFHTLNYKHFSLDGRRPGERSTAFDDPDRALRQLNATYTASSRHREALVKENAKARLLMQQCADPLEAMTFIAAPSSTLRGGGSAAASKKR